MTCVLIERGNFGHRPRHTWKVDYVKNTEKCLVKAEAEDWSDKSTLKTTNVSKPLGARSEAWKWHRRLLSLQDSEGPWPRRHL